MTSDMKATPATIWAETALTSEGWRDRVRLAVGEDGRIASIEAGAQPAPADIRVGVLLPSPCNLHSHAFQRAMAGLGERRGDAGRDSFWTWRALMYRFLEQLSPDDVEAIAAMVQLESLEAGFASMVEFHYLHHQPGGAPYDDVAETSARICAAAAATGIGLTLAPVLYERGGCDGRALGAGQLRFGNDRDRFLKLHQMAAAHLTSLPEDAGMAVAPHSLRAVSPEGLALSVALDDDRPVHIHIAEQTAEVEEVEAAYGARPVAWLLGAQDVGRRWCLIHATHMTPEETEGLARSDAVAGLCPITEASLGDGIFDGVRYAEAGGRFGVGSDSNIRISLSEELRLLEYGQRLRDRARTRLAEPARSTGRFLFDRAVAGGAQAAGRDAGAVAPGRFADLMALDADDPDLADRDGDPLLDGFVFAGADRAITDVWSAGRHVVRDGRHPKRDAIRARYREVLGRLADRL